MLSQAGKPDRRPPLAQPNQAGKPDLLLRGLEFSLARQNRDRFVAAEGMLSEAAAKSLEADFPPDRIFSATELETLCLLPLPVLPE